MEIRGVLARDMNLEPKKSNVIDEFIGILYEIRKERKNFTFCMIDEYELSVLRVNQ